MSVTERDKIIQRIKKLKAHADSARAIGSIEEAEAFALKYQELLLEYNLTLAEVDATSEVKKDPFGNWGITESISYHESVTDYRWRRELIRTLSRWNFTGWYIKGGAYREFVVYGDIENVDAVVYMYQYLSIGLLRLAKESYAGYGKPNGKKSYEYLKNFLYGTVAGVDDKLAKARAEQAKASSGVMALVKVTNGQLDTYAVSLGLVATKSRAAAISDTAAYARGVVAGKNFNVGEKLPNKGVKKLK